MPPKKFKPKQKRDRKAEALTRLKNRWEEDHEGEDWEPEAEPTITHLLKAATGGLPAVLAALGTYDNDEAQGFIALYDSLTPSDRKSLTIEQIAYASGIGSIRLAGLVTEALLAFGDMQTKILVGSSMAKVMKATVKAATDEVPIVADTMEGRIVVGKTNGDVKAMEMFHKMSGMMPLPKGAQIAIQNNFGEREERKSEPESHTWKYPEDRLKEIVAVVSPNKSLPAPEEKLSDIHFQQNRPVVFER